MREMTFGQKLQIAHLEELGVARVVTLMTYKQLVAGLRKRLEREITSAISQDRYPR